MVEPTLAPAPVAVVGAVVLVGGFLTGVNGFGYAVVGTTVLAAAFDPRTAVVVMLLPVLSANLSLLRELEVAELRRCARRFGPYVGGMAAGTLVGMVALSRVPEAPLALGLGLFTLGYVAVSQRAVAVPGRGALVERCFVETGWVQAVIGGVSGLVFGASNVGVQTIAYLESRDLSRRTFVGVVAMVFVGVSTLRVGAAAVLGLYGRDGVAALTVLAVGPGLIGIEAGRRVRDRLPERARRASVLGLLTVVGVRLVVGGATGV